VSVGGSWGNLERAYPYDWFAAAGDDNLFTTLGSIK